MGTEAEKASAMVQAMATALETNKKLHQDYAELLADARELHKILDKLWVVCGLTPTEVKLLETFTKKYGEADD